MLRNVCYQEQWIALRVEQQKYPRGEAIAMWENAVKMTPRESTDQMGPVLASNRCALSGATRNVVANISRGSVLPQDLPGVFILPAWASRVHSSHAVGGVSRLGLRYVGGVLGCTKCGGFATTQHTQSCDDGYFASVGAA